MARTSAATRTSPTARPNGIPYRQSFSVRLTAAMTARFITARRDKHHHQAPAAPDAGRSVMQSHAEVATATLDAGVGHQRADP
jgi:hypothetical protein